MLRSVANSQSRLLRLVGCFDGGIGSQQTAPCRRLRRARLPEHRRGETRSPTASLARVFLLEFILFCAFEYTLERFHDGFIFFLLHMLAKPFELFGRQAGRLATEIL